MLISLLRAIKFSLQDIARNVWLSITTIVILLLALFSINMLLTVEVISSAAIDAVKDKIDISLYIKSSAEETEIIALRSRVSNLSQVKDVKYISKAQALDEFKLKHQNDPDILESLRELGKNPLSPTLIIKPKDINQYDELIARLNSMDDPIIDSRNFDNHKSILNKVNLITNKVNQVGLIVSLVFVFVTIMVVYNAVRVAIYTHRREIKIMRLVGASKWFIRLPYVFTSMFYTLIGVLVIIIVYYPFLSLLQPYLEAFFVGYNINILAYFNDNFWLIFGGQFIAGSLINMIASLIAIRKYSKV